MNITPETIVSRLVGEFKYTPQEAQFVSDELLGVTTEVQQAFECWWLKGILIETLEAEGYTLQRLVNEFDLHPVAAILTMDWIIQEPTNAIHALREGYDSYALTSEDEDT